MSETSTKPYMLRALHEWCTDNGYTPHIAVRVDKRTRVPQQFVSNGEIVLNISYDATGQLQMSNDWVEFNARFGGKSHKIEIPVSNVLAIYARENGQGMAFPVEESDAANAEAGFEDVDGNEQSNEGEAEPASEAPSVEDVPKDGADEPPRPGGRPRLTVIK